MWLETGQFKLITRTGIRHFPVDIKSTLGYNYTRDPRQFNSLPALSCSLCETDEGLRGRGGKSGSSVGHINPAIPCRR